MPSLCWWDHVVWILTSISFIWMLSFTEAANGMTLTTVTETVNRKLCRIYSIFTIKPKIFWFFWSQPTVSAALSLVRIVGHWMFIQYLTPFKYILTNCISQKILYYTSLSSHTAATSLFLTPLHRHHLPHLSSTSINPLPSTIHLYRSSTSINHQPPSTVDLNQSLTTSIDWRPRSIHHWPPSTINLNW